MHLAPTTLDATATPHVPQATSLCQFCGQPEVAELLEIWSAREFMIDACCEDAHHALVDFLIEEPAKAGKWVAAQAGLSPKKSVRRVVDNGAGQLILDWHPTLVDVTFDEACAFIARHHRHCPAPRGWRFGAGVRNGPTLIGVVTCGRPVARLIDQQRIVEANRVCVHPGVPSALVWNACSMLYGHAARQARKRGFERIITYTLASEAGTSLLAAGFEPDHLTKGRRWASPSRPRGQSTPTEDKVRWQRLLVRHPTSRLVGNGGEHRPRIERLLEAAKERHDH